MVKRKTRRDIIGCFDRASKKERMVMSVKMKRAAGFVALMLAFAVFMSSVLLAHEDTESAAVDITVQTGAISDMTAESELRGGVDADDANSSDRSKKLSGVLLVSVVCGALVLTAVIWREKDKTKYL